MIGNVNTGNCRTNVNAVILSMYLFWRRNVYIVEWRLGSNALESRYKETVMAEFEVLPPTLEDIGQPHKP